MRIAISSNEGDDMKLEIRDRTEAAVEVARLTGGRVFPCVHHSKKPRHIGFQESASTEPSVIRELWRCHRLSNIGVMCGEGFWVLDIDTRHGGDKHLNMLQYQFGDLPATPCVRTNEGGVHYYFSTENYGKYQYDHKPFGSCGIEVNGRGRHVMGVGSVHESGHVYEWITKPEGLKFAPAPEWLLERVRRPFYARPVPTAQGGENTAYVKAALRSEALRLCAVYSGRNQALNDAAFRMGMYEHLGLRKEDAYRELVASCEINGYMDKDGSREVDSTFESGWNKGVLNPKDVT